MAELVTQFTTACSNVEPEPDDVSNASEAHLEVRKVLEKDAALVALGIDTILIGSYARQVSIRRVKDVDIFSKLPKLGTDVSSVELLELFMTALSEYGVRLELQDRSIKVDFPDFGLHVDAVPARTAGDVWEIPDRVAEGAAEAWQLTHPEGMGSESTAMNNRFGGNYVPVVKLIRQTRRAQLGDSRPGGHFFEVLAHHTFNEMSSDMDDANRPRLYVAALRGIATKLAEYRDGAEIEDPSMPGEHITIRATAAEKAAAAAVFADVAARAENALADAVCASAVVFRALLGKNDGGDWVFPLPTYCNADGTEKATASSASRSVPAGNERFG